MKTYLIAAFALAAAVPAQQASVTPYGTGCAIQGQTPAIGNRGLPQLGTSFDITYTGPNFTFSSAQQIMRPTLILGFTQLAIPVPPIFPQQPASCFVLTTADVSMTMQPDQNGRPVFDSSVTFRVPNDPALSGARFNGQWLAVFEQCGIAGCDIAGVATSDAAQFVLGT